MLATNRIVPESGEVAFGSISGTAAGSANTVLTLAGDSGQLGFENTTDIELCITLGGVKKKRVPAYSFRVFDFAENGGRIDASTVVGVYYDGGTAPTVGNIEVTSMPMVNR